MSHIADEITAVEREQLLGVRPLDEAERDRIRQRLRARYGGGDHWMWQDAADGVSIQDPDGWRWIGGFVGARPCILLFNAREETEMFALPSGEALNTLLGETTGFEFYVTDAEASYRISFNHHDFLSCHGAARAWLEEWIADG